MAALLPQFRAVFHGSSEPLGVVAAAFVIVAVGTLDDVRDVSAPAKLAGMTLAASVLYLLGVMLTLEVLNLWSYSR